MSIDALPAAPAPTDSTAAFDTKAFALLAALTPFVSQTNATAADVQTNADITAALALGMALPNYGGTSTTSLVVGTGAQSFTTQTGKSWVPGQVVVATNGANLMKGTVTAYSGATLDVNVTTISGSGTFASWTIGLSYAGLVLAASGNNNDITGLNALASVPAVVVTAIGSTSKIQPVATPTLSANALTIPAVAFTLDFRKPTLTAGGIDSVTGTPAALVIPAGATLGTTSAIKSYLADIVMNNAGTLERAVVNLAGGVDLTETGLISTTAISAGATAANVVYSNTARSNLPYRVVGRYDSTQATAGQWATAPSLVVGLGGQGIEALGRSYKKTKDVTSIRTAGVTYYNTCGRQLAVNTKGSHSSYGVPSLAIQVDGDVLWYSQLGQSGQGISGDLSGFAVVPIDSSYVCSGHYAQFETEIS